MDGFIESVFVAGESMRRIASAVAAPASWSAMPRVDFTPDHLVAAIGLPESRIPPQPRLFAGVRRLSKAFVAAATLAGGLFLPITPLWAAIEPSFCAEAEQGEIADPLEGLVAACTDPAGSCYPHDIQSPQLRLFLWVVRGVPAGSGGLVAGVSPSQVEAALAQIAADYNPTGISFSVAGQSFLDDQALYERAPGTDTPGEIRAHILTNYQAGLHTDAIDVFLLPDDPTKRVIGGAGDGTKVPDSWLFAGGTQYYATDVVGHELGHALGLFHTFEILVGGVEYPPFPPPAPPWPEGLCRTAGDRICDTPPDPYTRTVVGTTVHDCWHPLIDENCEYSVNVAEFACDPTLTQGEITDYITYYSLFAPDTQNIMSYYIVPATFGEDAISCPSTFTPLQADRMLATIERHPMTQREWGVSGSIPAGALEATLAGDVLLLGDVLIGGGKTLRLAPGAVVWSDATDLLASGMDPTRVEWAIWGSVISEATAGEPATFRVLSSDPQKKWGPIHVFESAGQTLSFANVIFEDLELTPVTDVLQSPDGGEVYAEGDAVQVTWSTTSSYVGSAPNVESRANRVDLVLSIGGQEHAIATGIPNTGSYVWTPDGADVGASVTLKVVFHHPVGEVVGEDTSNAAFTVVGSGQFVNLSGETGLDYEGTPYSAISLDYNGDGYLDLMITQFDEPGELYARTGLSPHGAPIFTSRTIDAFPSNAPQAGLRGLTFDSFNDDARPDVFAADASNPRLYRNDGPVGVGGEVIFTDVADAVGLNASATNSWAGAWGHMDNDGRVDLLVARAGIDPPPPPPNIEHPKSDLGRQQTALLRNVLDANGQVVFQNVASTRGVTWTGDLGVVGITALWGDFDGVNGQDIFVGDRANEPFGDSRLFLNDGDGTLTRAENQGPDGLGSVTSAVWADVDGDLDADLVITQEPLTSTAQPLVCTNQSNTLAAPVSLPSQITAASGVAVLDENLDLMPDVLVTPIDPDDSPQLLYGVKLPSEEHTFLDGTERTGLDQSRGTVHGLVVAQFDPDARPDIYLGRTVASDAIYYRSQERAGSGKLSGAGVQLVGGLGGNDFGAVGAKVVLKQDGQPVALQVVDGGSGRGSQGSPQLIFATPDTLASYSVEITWQEGYVQTAAVQRDTLTVIADHTNPTIHATSMAASYQPQVGGLATWVFEFDTDWLPKVDGDEIVVSSTAGCLNEPITLRDSQPNVTVTMAAKVGGGWHHTVEATGMECIPNCVYTWYCKGSTAYESSTTQANPKTFKTKVCAQ